VLKIGQIIMDIYSPSRRNMLRLIAAGTVCSTFPSIVLADQGFRDFVADFRSVALKNGISAQVYSSAFAGIDSIDPEVLEKARFQPEFKAPVWDYFDNRVHERSVTNGQSMAKKYRPWLDKIERRFGVDRHILLAIWSMETNYGEILKRPEVIRSTIRSLATLAYADKRRAKFGRTQLLAALKILQRGDVDVEGLQGSWAGAMGHTQFIPTSFMIYGVDIDGDGRRNIWTSVPDALASSANLLKQNGWQSGRAWGYEVALPQGVKLSAGTASLDSWAAKGVARASGKPFRNGGDGATLKLPDGRSGPAFLVMKNFRVIKAYNNADKYALAVGVLADRISGSQELVRDWNRPFTALNIAEKEEMQGLLSKAGYYDGKADGNIGSGTKAAILAYQQAAGLTPDGYPSKELLNVLRRQ
jgi:membrane-bound lytic murein transglycosylase B